MQEVEGRREVEAVSPQVGLGRLQIDLPRLDGEFGSRAAITGQPKRLSGEIERDHVEPPRQLDRVPSGAASEVKRPSAAGNMLQRLGKKRVGRGLAGPKLAVLLVPLQRPIIRPLKMQRAPWRAL